MFYIFFINLSRMYCAAKPKYISNWANKWHQIERCTKNLITSPRTLCSVHCTVYAMANFPSMKNVLIIPRITRADDELIADVSEYGNDMLVSQIASTVLSSIKLGSMESIPCKTVCEKSDLFGSRQNMLTKIYTHIQI